MYFPEIKRVKTVVAVHMRMKDRQSQRMCSHLPHQKLHHRRSLSTDDKSAGIKEIIPFEKRTLRAEIRRSRTLFGNRNSSLEIFCKLFFADPKLLADL